MAITINGTTGIAGVDGSAGTPAIQGADTNTGMFFPAADTIAFAEGGAEIARFDSSGNFGIGTTDATSTRLRVKGVGTSSSTYQIYTQDSSSNVVFVSRDDGNVGIGTGSPSEKLHVQTAGNVQIRLQATGANYVTYGLYNSSQNYSMQIRTDQSNAWVLRDETAGVNRMLCITSGQVGVNVSPAAGNTFRVVNIGADNAVQFGNASNGVYLPSGGTSFSAYSDIRLKNITGRYETPLEDIAKLDAIKFTWKNDEGNKPCVGVSAQSVETVIPEAIDRSTNFNAEGDTTEYLSVKYTELIPLMIASIQELKAINDTQASTITALTARITALEGASV